MLASMAAASIDTHKLFKTLEAAGFEPAKADAILSVASGLRDSAEVATKSDLRELERLIKSDLRELELCMKSDLRELELRMKSDLRELELRMTIKLGGMMAAAIGVTAVLVKLL